MQIDHYSSGGHMRIDGKIYRRDLKIIDGRVKGDWWRKEGHRLDPSDIADILDAAPDTLVIGTGYAGVMRVPDTTRAAISASGTRVIAEPTGRAVQTFNQVAATGATVAGAFHLTC